jgi:hypothetical protein
MTRARILSSNESTPGELQPDMIKLGQNFLSTAALATVVASRIEEMPVKHDGQEYAYVVGSDVIRDGMYIEVCDEPDSANEILEIFYSDVSRKMSVTLYKPDVPLEVVEWAIAIARERLPVKIDATD